MAPPAGAPTHRRVVPEARVESGALPHKRCLLLAAAVAATDAQRSCEICRRAVVVVPAVEGQPSTITMGAGAVRTAGRACVGGSHVQGGAHFCASAEGLYGDGIYLKRRVEVAVRRLHAATERVNRPTHDPGIHKRRMLPGQAIQQRQCGVEARGVDQPDCYPDLAVVCRVQQLAAA